MEFLSSLVFHTVTIQVIPHYYKQSLVQYKKKNKKKKNSRIGWNAVVHRTVSNTNEDRSSFDFC